MVHGLAKLFTDLGGKIILNSEVSKINIDQKQITGITLGDGRVVNSDIVISNADVAHTYLNLIDKKHRK